MYIALTTKSSKQIKQKSSIGFKKPPVLVAGLFIFAIVILVITFTKYSEKKLIPLTVIALVAGVVYENHRLTEKWSTTLYNAFYSFLLSFLAFCPGKHEHDYNLENHIQFWPYSFIIIFIIIGITFNKDKIIPKLTEGITLLQSIAIIYWLIDYGFIGTNNIFVIILLAIGLLFSIFSIFNAFSYITLSSTTRFILSLWSSIIMVLFAADNIYRVYQNELIENTTSLTQGLFIGLQYFVLGVCSIYIVQNFLMLVEFLPGKRRFFNEDYFMEVKALKNDHIKRFSDIQINKLDSLLCIVLVGSVFCLNYYLRLLPRNVAIWVVFITFPYIILIYKYLRSVKNQNSAVN